MAKKHGIFAALGCLIIFFVGGGLALLIILSRASSLPGNMIVSLRFQGPVVEIAPDDPLAQLTGEKPLALRDIRRALIRAADDDRVRGISLRIDSFGGGFAQLQEVRTLLERVRAAGKWTAAYLDTAGEFSPGNTVYYLASACDEISLNPAGEVNFIGLSSRSPFIRGTLDKLGVKPEFPGRGRYKTARFMYTKTDFTPEHREMIQWLLGSLMDEMMGDVARARSLDPAAVKNIVDGGPLSAEAALEAKLVDQLQDWGAFRKALEDREEGNAKFVGYSRYLRGNPASSNKPKIAVVTASGAIMRGRSGKSMNPLVGGEIMGSDTIAKAWRDVRKNKGVKAVVFRINSPGGSAVASEIIRQEMVRTAKKLPVIVSMSNYAASGGYWITCGARKIVADPGTLTASIGVFGGHFNTEAFWRDKIGISYGKLDFGANANIYGELEDWNDAQRAIVNRQLDRIYSDFLQRVADSRHKTVEEVDAMAEGRVFTGRQALEKGLVDALGGFDEALELARKEAGLSPGEDVTLVDYPKVLPWWEQILNRQKNDEASARAMAATLERWISTGRIETPGVLWQPPITVE